jgi:hypothetical protein
MSAGPPLHFERQIQPAGAHRAELAYPRIIVLCRTVHCAGWPETEQCSYVAQRGQKATLQGAAVRKFLRRCRRSGEIQPASQKEVGPGIRREHSSACRS